MALETMALVITEKNYDIVAAVLPAGFLNVLPVSKTYGCVLVLNETHGCRLKLKDGTERFVKEIGNSWMSASDFADKYKTANGSKLSSKKFFEVKLV